MNLEKLIKNNKIILLDELKTKLGIVDDILVKIKDIKQDNWLGLYRAFSQFKSKPIIWINKDIIKISNEYEYEIDINDLILDTLIHEYGHIIAEFGKTRNKKIHNLIKKHWSNEEEFAEEFIFYIKNMSFSCYPYDEIIKLYIGS